ncbi:MAG: hypothetical protein R2822_07345 [Spirosomataceae bacterium]
MYRKCAQCGEDFEREPGFYFWSYVYQLRAFHVALIITSFIGYIVVLGGDEITLLYYLVPALILVMPLFFRLGRRVWINIFVKFKKERSKLDFSNN